MELISNKKSLFPTCEVLVSGCFNLLHPGHIELLDYASGYGKVTVGLNGDQYMIKKYGEGNFLPLVHRAKLMNSLKQVDSVVFFQEDEPSKLILKLRPAYYVRGPDYGNKELPEMEALEAIGGQLIIHQSKKIYNSSELIVKPWVKSIIHFNDKP